MTVNMLGKVEKTAEKSELHLENVSFIAYSRLGNRIGQLKDPFEVCRLKRFEFCLNIFVQNIPDVSIVQKNWNYCDLPDVNSEFCTS